MPSSPDFDSPPRPAVLGWWSALAGALFVASVYAIFRSARDAYPIGDEAMLEIYTLHAVRGMWPLGPYSQFGWHHLGPLYFYLLAPLYEISGEKTIAMHAGALALNLLSLSALVYTLLRYAAPAVTWTIALAFAVYAYRLEPMIASYWNPHIVVLPAATYVVLSAAVADGRYAVMPVAALVGSFLIQTHISLAPCVLALGSGALIAATFARRDPAPVWGLHRWMVVSTCVLAVLWLFPLIEEVSHAPGNISRVMRFFRDPSPGQEARTAVFVWGEMISGLFRGDFHLPAGVPLPIATQTFTGAGAAAIAQMVLLAVACLDAARRRDRFLCALTAAGLLASAMTLFSITRAKSLIGEYTVFWLSSIGALNWAVIGGVVLTRLAGVRLGAIQRWAAVGASAFLVSWFLYIGNDELKRARRHGLSSRDESAKRVQLASEAIISEIQRRDVRRPLFRLNTQDWGEGVGVVLQVYKRRGDSAVDTNLVWFFGEPLAPVGREDRVFVIADATREATMTRPPGDEVIARFDQMYVHSRPIASASPTQRKP